MSVAASRSPTKPFCVVRHRAIAPISAAAGQMLLASVIRQAPVPSFQVPSAGRADRLAAQEIGITNGNAGVS